MNPIEEGISRLENGWCTGHLQDGDKFCAVGSIAISLLDGVERITGLEEDEAYDRFNAHPASKVLAQAVLDSEWLQDNPQLDASLHRDFEYGSYSCVVFGFNDRQESVEPVLELFRQANKIYTQGEVND
jgi:hypothetical protein